MWLKRITSNQGTAMSEVAIQEAVRPSKLTFRPLKQYPSDVYDHILHYKGFALRMDFQNPHTWQLAQSCMNHMKESGCATLAWDGDSYSEESFTWLIPQIVEATGVKLIAFLLDIHQERFQKSWGHMGMDVTIYLVPSDGGKSDFTYLGLTAIRTTGANCVLSLGGGQVVMQEFQHAPRHVRYLLWPAHRRTPCKSEWEAPKLLEIGGHERLDLYVIQDSQVPETPDARIAEEIDFGIESPTAV
mmetsp:Transcript_4442/g.9296  ORF Transcript_4442/g.9296 Transcript_4442/m.9296 type:complete len:244 (+) Transcript_4442:1-732(+)